MNMCAYVRVPCAHMRVSARMHALKKFFFKDFIYLFMSDREREREAETQAEVEAGSTQGAQHGTRSWVSRIRPWAEGGAKPLSPLGSPACMFASVRTHTHVMYEEQLKG